MEPSCPRNLEPARKLVYAMSVRSREAGYDLKDWNHSVMHKRLNEHAQCKLSALSFEYLRPDKCFESVADRLYAEDAFAGVLDPDLVSKRDTCVVKYTPVDGSEVRELRLNSFLCHLITRQQFIAKMMGQSTEVNPIMEKIFDDGTWAGFLLWDSAMHLSNELLVNPEMAQLVRGKKVLELGCGLGLPGFVCAAWLDSESVLLTDRGAVVDICDTNISKTGCRGIEARRLEWDNIEDLEACGDVEILLAADCIFQPLYGASFPLWDVILRFNQLARDNGRSLPTVLLSSERRPDDGVDAFLDTAKESGATLKEWWRYEDFENTGQHIYIYQITCQP